ncbi:response regulator [Burkholderia gladioli]|uniref:response regulator n=1 Tax=Burkholderia gladioli TaxID=28095 RepID=UPI0019D1E603|nr:response regulator [Burkholderia gladioli]
MPQPEHAYRILIADNAYLRAYLQRLSSRYYTVKTAVDDGIDTLEKALALPPDLVLSDVTMPKLDGFGLLARLSHRFDPAVVGPRLQGSADRRAGRAIIWSSRSPLVN